MTGDPVCPRCGRSVGGFARPERSDLAGTDSGTSGSDLTTSSAPPRSAPPQGAPSQGAPSQGAPPWSTPPDLGTAIPDYPDFSGFPDPPAAGHWTCPRHGPVTPLHPFRQPDRDQLGWLAADSRVPIWMPWPLPAGWAITGTGYAGCHQRGIRATVLACTGPSPFGGGGELLLVAEEMGIGLGARYAALPGPDPGAPVGHGVPQARVDTDRHPTALWQVESPPDRAVYVGAAAGLWLWLVFFPEDAGALLVESLDLTDVRLLGKELDLLPFGALTPRLDHPEP